MTQYFGFLSKTLFTQLTFKIKKKCHILAEKSLSTTILYESVVGSYRTSEYFSETKEVNTELFWILLKNFESHNKLLKL